MADPESVPQKMKPLEGVNRFISEESFGYWKKFEFRSIDSNFISPPWTMSSFTPAQLKSLDEFINRLKQNNLPLSHNLDLMRWLVARKFDVDAAFLMYSNMLKWRARTRADQIFEDFPKSPYYQNIRNY